MVVKKWWSNASHDNHLPKLESTIIVGHFLILSCEFLRCINYYCLKHHHESWGFQKLDKKFISWNDWFFINFFDFLNIMWSNLFRFLVSFKRHPLLHICRGINKDKKLGGSCHHTFSWFLWFLIWSREVEPVYNICPRFRSAFCKASWCCSA